MKKIFSDLRGSYRYSVSAKINTIFAITIFIFGFFSIYDNYIIRTSNNGYNKTISYYYEIVKLKEAVIFCDKSINEYFYSRNLTYLSDFNNTTVIVSESLKKLNLVKSNTNALYLTGSISDSFETYRSICNTACFKFYENNYDFYVYQYKAQGINKYLQKYCDELLMFFLEDGEKLSSEMLAKQNLLATFSGFSIIIVILLFISSVVYVNVIITRPLNILSSASRKIASGNFDVEVPNKSTNDAVGILFIAFNMMTQNIKMMLLNIKENAKTENSLLIEQKKNIEYQHMLSMANFLALQTQTNPHFLFNTLNSISRTITLGMSDEAVTMIDSMVALLRYNLTDASLHVTLEEELYITKEYLKIQKYRFGDRISYEIDCEHNISKQIVLPRFTLQPLVENAIIHGLEPKANGGIIKIIVKEYDEKFVIKVIDNGMAIDPIRLKKIQEINEGIGHTNSIGVSNTKKRIIIFTKDNNSFKLKSKIGFGTIALISIPKGDM